jgi:hypothetical protein
MHTRAGIGKPFDSNTDLAVPLDSEAFAIIFKFGHPSSLLSRASQVRRHVGGGAILARREL